jgi:hypothetical protein
MANIDAPFGFVPVRMQGGAPFSGGQSEYTISSTYGTNIFTGDLAIQAADGDIEVSAATSTNNIGVFNGCFYTDSNGKPQYAKYWPASTTSTDAVAFIIDDPNVIFEAQEDGSALALADRGTNTDLVATAGSTTTGRSGHEIDSDETGSAATAQFRVVAVSKDPSNNTVASANCNWYVKILEHLNGPQSTAGI